MTAAGKIAARRLDREGAGTRPGGKFDENGNGLATGSPTEAEPAAALNST